MARGDVVVLGDSRLSFYRRHVGTGARNSERFHGKHRLDWGSPDRLAHRLRRRHSFHECTCSSVAQSEAPANYRFSRTIARTGFSRFHQAHDWIAGKKNKIKEGGVFYQGECAGRAVSSGPAESAGKLWTVQSPCG